jgi:hypothetical protein
LGGARPRQARSAARYEVHPSQAGTDARHAAAAQGPASGCPRGVNPSAKSELGRREQPRGRLGAWDRLLVAPAASDQSPPACAWHRNRLDGRCVVDKLSGRRAAVRLATIHQPLRPFAALVMNVRRPECDDAP